MRHRPGTKAGGILCKFRKRTVKMDFGLTKAVLGIGRFSLRGLAPNPPEWPRVGADLHATPSASGVPRLHCTRPVASVNASGNLPRPPSFLPIAPFDPKVRNLEGSQPESQECASHKGFFSNRKRGRTAFDQVGFRGETIWPTRFFRDLADLLAGKPEISVSLIITNKRLTTICENGKQKT